MRGTRLDHVRLRAGDRRPEDRRSELDLMQICTHAHLLPIVGATFDDVVLGRPWAASLWVRCPDCWREVQARFWRPALGGWYLQIKECFVAGRTWNFRYERGRWLAAV